MQRIKNDIKSVIGLRNYYKLLMIPCNKDVRGPSSVTHSVDYNDFNESIRDLIMSLPLVKFTGRFDQGGLNKKQRFYMMTTLNQNFIVDTGNTNYAKYVTLIKNLPDLSNKEIEDVVHSNEYIKMVQRTERFSLEYEEVPYTLEITQEGDETFISIEHNGSFVMDSKLESDIIKYFNDHK